MLIYCLFPYALAKRASPPRNIELISYYAHRQSIEVIYFESRFIITRHYFSRAFAILAVLAMARHMPLLLRIYGAAMMMTIFMMHGQR